MDSVRLTLLRAALRGLAIVLCFLALTHNNGHAQAPVKQVGTLSLGWVKSTGNLLAYLSPQYGERYGLKVNLETFSNSQDITTAMISGQIDIGLMTPIHFIRAIDGNLKFVQIAGNTRGGNGIILARKLGIAEHDWAGLKKLLSERRLRAAAYRGSVNEILATAEFAQHGISMQKDIDLMNITNPAQHPQALRSGEFDMIVTLEPLATMVVAEGIGTLFSHGYGSPAGDLNTDFVARSDWLEKNPQVAQAFVQTLAAEYAILTADKATELATAVKLTGLAPDVVKQALANTRYELGNGVPQMQALAKFAFEQKYTTRDVSAEIPKYVEERFLRGAGIAP